MRLRIIRIVIVALGLMQALPVSAAPGDIYTLNVKLTDVDHSTSEHHISLVPEAPFQFVKIGQPTRTTVSGVLHEPKNNLYALDLTVVAWNPGGAPTNFTQNWTLALELGKPQPVTAQQSKVFQATLDLKKDLAASPVPQ